MALLRLRQISDMNGSSWAAGRHREQEMIAEGPCLRW
jgi:hypothetical protein